MLGFPPTNQYSGPDVFSHVALQKVSGGDGRSPIVVDEVGVDPSLIHKPIYSKYNEILVYRDSEILHSAPDKTNREGVWRFM